MEMKKLSQEQARTLKENAKKDEKGSYIFDPSKPIGSIQNPFIVGMPEYSDILIYDVENNRWILTDGLGNGWIR